MDAAQPPPQIHPAGNRGLAIAHIILGGLWLPVGLVVGYMLTFLIVFTSTHGGPSCHEFVTVTFKESRPVEALIFVALFALLPTTLLTVSGVCMLRSVARGFSLLVAWLSCLVIPVGTILGVWTLLALRRKAASSKS